METPGSSEQDREEIKKRLKHMKKRYASMQKKLQKSVKQKKVKEHVQKKLSEQALLQLTEQDASPANVTRRDNSEDKYPDLGSLQIGPLDLDNTDTDVKLNRKCVSSSRPKKRRSVSFVLEDDKKKGSQCEARSGRDEKIPEKNQSKNISKAETCIQNQVNTCVTNKEDTESGGVNQETDERRISTDLVGAGKIMKSGAQCTPIQWKGTPDVCQGSTRLHRRPIFTCPSQEDSKMTQKAKRSCQEPGKVLGLQNPNSKLKGRSNKVGKDVDEVSSNQNPQMTQKSIRTCQEQSKDVANTDDDNVTSNSKESRYVQSNQTHSSHREATNTSPTSLEYLTEDDLSDNVLCIEETQNSSQILGSKRVFKNEDKHSLDEGLEMKIKTKDTNSSMPGLTNSSSIKHQPLNFGLKQDSYQHNSTENCNVSNTQQETGDPITQTFSDPGPIKTSRRGRKRSKRIKELTTSDISMKEVVENSQNSQEGHHTWIEGLIYPAEYYVRKTRSMSGKVSPVLYSENLLTGVVDGLQYLSQTKRGCKQKIMPSPSVIRTLPGVGVKTKPEIGLKTGPGVGLETEPQIGVKTEPEIGVKSKPQIGVKTEPEIGVKIGLETRPQIGVEAGPEIRLKTEPDSVKAFLSVSEQNRINIDSISKVPSQFTKADEASVECTDTTHCSVYNKSIITSQTPQDSPIVSIFSQSSNNSSSINSNISAESSIDSNSSKSRKNLSLSRKKKGLKKGMRKSIVDLTVEDSPSDQQQKSADILENSEKKSCESTQENDTDASCKSDFEFKNILSPEVSQKISKQMSDFALPDAEYGDLKLLKSKMGLTNKAKCKGAPIQLKGQMDLDENSIESEPMDPRNDNSQVHVNLLKPSTRKKHVKASTKQQSQKILESQFSQSQLDGDDIPSAFHLIGCSPGSLSVCMETRPISPTRGIETRPTSPTRGLETRPISPTSSGMFKPSVMFSPTSPNDAATLSPQNSSSKDLIQYNEDRCLHQDHILDETDIFSKVEVNLQERGLVSNNKESLPVLIPKSVPSRISSNDSNLEKVNMPDESKHHLASHSSTDARTDMQAVVTIKEDDADEFSPPTDGVVTPPMTSGNISQTSPFADVATATPYGKAEIPMCQSQCDPRQDAGMLHGGGGVAGDDADVEENSGIKFAGSFQHDVSDFKSPISGLCSYDVMLENQRTPCIIVYSAELVILWVAHEEKDWRIHASWTVSQEEKIQGVHPIPSCEEDSITLGITGCFNKCQARILRYNFVNGVSEQKELTLPSYHGSDLVRDFCPVSSDVLLMQITDNEDRHRVYRFNISEDLRTASCDLMFESNGRKISMQKVNDVDDMAVLTTGHKIELWHNQIFN